MLTNDQGTSGSDAVPASFPEKPISFGSYIYGDDAMSPKCVTRDLVPLMMMKGPDDICDTIVMLNRRQERGRASANGTKGGEDFYVG